MTQIKFYAPVKEMNGEFEKGSGIIMRKKKYRAPSGKVMREGVQESYRVVNPRDYTLNPPKGKELENIMAFTDSKKRCSEILHSEKISDEELAAMTSEGRRKTLELRAELEDFKNRFYAQFTQPDPEAPYEKKPSPNSMKLLQKQYSKLDNFIQAIIRERSKKLKS